MKDESRSNVRVAGRAAPSEDYTAAISSDLQTNVTSLGLYLIYCGCLSRPARARDYGSKYSRSINHNTWAVCQGDDPTHTGTYTGGTIKCWTK